MQKLLTRLGKKIQTAFGLDKALGTIEQQHGPC
jgi:hypothetical protein